HPPVVMDVAEQQVAALLPPQRPLGRALRSAEAIGKMLDPLRSRDDPLQLRRQLLNPRRQIIRHWQVLPWANPYQRSRTANYSGAGGESGAESGIALVPDDALYG